MKLFSILYVLEKRSIFNPKITAAGVEKKKKKHKKTFHQFMHHIYDITFMISVIKTNIIKA